MDAGVGPDPSQAADLAEFIRLLGELRIWAGAPSYRTLAKRVGPLMRPPQAVSQSTVGSAFQPRRRRLDLDLVVAIVRALRLDEPDVARWRAACVVVHAGQKVGGAAGVFRQLPADLGTFTGREEQLARLVEEATACRSAGARTVVVSAIEGMAGVGKTQLAVHAAHTLVRAGRFADVQLYVNLRGFDPEQPPVDPAAVLDAFLRQLEVPAQQIPDGRDERAAMFRDRLHGKEALILLDNAASEDQVRDLIPSGSGCAVLITSRRSLAGLDGASLCLLDVFTPSEALDLLGRIAGPERIAAEPEAAEQLVRACGLLPLAVALVASRLRARPVWTLADLVGRLQADGLDVVAAGTRMLRPVLDLSYRELREETRRVFRLLSLHPCNEFGGRAVAVLADLSPVLARTVLDYLLNEHLLQEKTPGRYELHDLLRAFAAERIEIEHDRNDARASLERLLRWYQHCAHRALIAMGIDDPLPEVLRTEGMQADFDSYEKGLAWFDAERENLISAIRAAAGIGLHETAWMIAATMKEYFFIRHRLADCIQTHRDALASARALEDQSAEALILNGLGGAYRMLRLSLDAESCFRRVVELRQATGDMRGEAAGWINLGTVFRDQGLGSAARDVYTKALILCRESGDVRIEGIACVNIGVMAFDRGDLHGALEYYDKALALYRRVGWRIGQTVLFANYSDVHSRLGDFDAALASSREALAVSGYLGNERVQAESYMSIGDLLRAAGRAETARQAWRDALALFDKIGLSAAAADCRRRLGN